MNKSPKENGSYTLLVLLTQKVATSEESIKLHIVLKKHNPITFYLVFVCMKKKILTDIVIENDC